jgi:hypothetical protein
MKPRYCVAASAILFAVSTAALAAPHLTPQECNSFPFARSTGEVTHQQLVQELDELESVGYLVNEDNAYYPNDILRAKRKLWTEYRQDCKPGGLNTSVSG